MLSDNRIWFGSDGSSRPYQKKFLTEVQQGIVPTTIWGYDDAGHNIGAKSQIRDLFPESTDLFDTPKPTKLISRILDLVITNDGDIVMDFFAGSGTTGHAVMDRNASVGAKNKFILVQIPEAVTIKDGSLKTISDITIERVKRAAKELRDDHHDAALDSGFKVLRLNESYFPQNTFNPDPGKSETENIKALEVHLRDAAQLRIFEVDEFQGVVTEIALKNGFGLFYSLEPLDAFNANAVYRLSGNDKSAILCLDAQLDGKTIEALKDHSDDQLIVLKAALDTTKKFELQTAFQDNLWVV